MQICYLIKFYWSYTIISFRDEKKFFIRAKYEKKRFAIVTCTHVDDRRQDLKQAIFTHDMSALLQVFAEGIDFLEPLPDMVVVIQALFYDNYQPWLWELTIYWQLPMLAGHFQMPESLSWRVFCSFLL